MSQTQKFAKMLEAALRQSSTELVSGNCYRVRGRLDIGSQYVTIEIWFPVDFRDFKRVPPRVWCEENWMRQGADWHNSSTTGLCWVIDNMWRDVMGWRGKPKRWILNEGYQWLFNDVRCLITRHRYAYDHNINAWPKKWDFWSHYGEGIREYERTKRRHRSRRQR